MFETYRKAIPKYQKLSLEEERRLIAQAKKGDKGKVDELILRHIGFILFRIHKIIFPIYCDRFSEDILSQLVFILYDKIQSYNLRYKDKHDNPKPVRFSSYVWKRIDGFIIDYLKKELARERREQSLDQVEATHENDALIYEALYK
jgi:DNA-directed RNA polymerase specialized sigma subunit